jgi:sugar phosphate isomerase/epimerase
VQPAGGHHTVQLGTGSVDIAGAVRKLRSIVYDGVLRWEDEPEDRNPFDIAVEIWLDISPPWNA